MMSYIDVNWDFSQFDRDNSARQHAAGYAKIAARIAAGIPGDLGGRITSANTHLNLAQMAFATHNYGTALTQARLLYEDVAAPPRSPTCRSRPRAQHVGDRRAGQARQRARQGLRQGQGHA